MLIPSRSAVSGAVNSSISLRMNTVRYICGKEAIERVKSIRKLSSFDGENI